MKKFNTFTVHGTAVGSENSIRLDEISILADPETIRALGAFLIRAADEMAVEGVEHVHLQDLVENFSHEDHVDVIVLNGDLIKSA
ncbi:hypothetical protein C1893_08820 [Pseudomonas sp. MPR-ANC1]|uniref:Imm32 family immunity protein n=1 Tax=Pseudomonas sp. MPR-ANC1 TaxID=2075548 RepID=UPI000CD26E90|nr:hypothetical protein [Pseudomonas sp. MPR-ANC1]POA49007.1 hypothetical protein C1893_08820 [Pseudomonas sp. MPR-ANC1]